MKKKNFAAVPQGPAKKFDGWYVVRAENWGCRSVAIHIGSYEDFEKTVEQALHELDVINKNDHLKDMKDKPDPHWNAWTADLDTTGGYVAELVHLDTWDGCVYCMTTLVHELTHVTHRILDDCGVNWVPRNDEVFAYTMHTLLGSVLEALKKGPWRPSAGKPGDAPSAKGKVVAK